MSNERRNRRRDYAKQHGSLITKSFEEKGNYQKDERFWMPTRDKNGTGSAVIRFLPNADDQNLPWKKSFKHYVRSGKNFFIHNCAKSIGEECPVCDWNDNQDEDIVKGNATYRKKGFISNILVIQDKANPENEGKVFLFDYGPQVFDILKDTLQPDPEMNLEPLYFYSLDTGANFRILVKKEGQFPTWSKSKFMAPSNIDDDLEKLGIDDDYIFDNIYDLGEIVTTKSYIEYEKLKNMWFKFLKKTGIDDKAIDSSYEKTEEEAVKTYSRVKSSTPKTTVDTEENEPPKQEIKPSRRSESGKKKIDDYFNLDD